VGRGQKKGRGAERGRGGFRRPVVENEEEFNNVCWVDSEGQRWSKGRGRAWAQEHGTGKKKGNRKEKQKVTEKANGRRRLSGKGMGRCS